MNVAATAAPPIVLTDEQCARVAALLSLAPKGGEES